MTDIGLIFLYSLLAIASVAVICSALRRGSGKERAYRVVFLEFMVLGWLLALIAYYGSRSYEVSAFLYDKSLPFVAMASFALFMFMMRFYGITAYCGRVMRCLLLVIPAITAVLVLLPGHEYIYAGLKILSTAPYHEAEEARNLWFWVHAGYCYVLMMIVSVTAMVQYRKAPQLYRKASGLVVIGVAVSVIGNVITLSGINTTHIDFAIVCGSICTVLLHFATRHNQGLAYLIEARSKVYDELDDIILILDDERKIIYRNNAFRALVAERGIAEEEADYAKVAEQLFRGAKKSVLLDEEHSGVDYAMPHTGRIYNVRERQMKDRRGRPFGGIVICADVTQVRGVLRRLEEEAGMDALTGLSNRTRMEQAKREMDASDVMPIAVIVGDLNNLKLVNDTLGHGMGDTYLRVVSKTLLNQCPPGAHIGRMGGDEFLVMLPEYSLAQAEALAARLGKVIDALSYLPFAPSVSFGCAAKEARDMPIESVIAEADEAMYYAKRMFKGRAQRSGA